VRKVWRVENWIEKKEGEDLNLGEVLFGKTKELFLKENWNFSFFEILFWFFIFKSHLTSEMLLGFEK